MKKSYPATCQNPACGKEFETTADQRCLARKNENWKMYCSNKCRLEMSKSRVPVLICQNPTCGKEFRRQGHRRLEMEKYCSATCGRQMMRIKKTKHTGVPATAICVGCRKEITLNRAQRQRWATGHRGFFCNKLCFEGWQSRKSRRERQEKDKQTVAVIVVGG
jgi:hypothetical protein